MKCLKCGYEEELDLDEVLECQEMTENEDYAMFCPNCGKERFVPKSIYKEKIPPR
jgi:DNA-directed RNA polymerase subunit RPC12/RpoP